MDWNELRVKVNELSKPESGVSPEFSLLSVADTKKLLDRLAATHEVFRVETWTEGEFWMARVNDGEPQQSRSRVRAISYALTEYAVHVERREKPV